MLKRPPSRLVLATLLFFSISGCSSSRSDSPDRASSDTSSPAPTQGSPANLLVADKVVAQGEIRSAAFPSRGILLALSRWGSTTLAVFDISRKTLLPVVTKTTGELVVSLAGGRVAYLEREGVDPTKNSVEILDLKRGKSLLIKAADDFAILGFSLDPSGKHLAYAQVNLRWSRSHRVFWRTALADLERYETRISLASGQNNLGSGEIPVPFAWSGRTGEILLQGLLPFRGMIHQGIWAMKTNSSGPRRVLSEPSYTGLPRLSPDGSYLAYLMARLEALPRDYIPSPGAPPGNVLGVMNLLTGERSVLAQEGEAAFGALGWSASGRELLVSHRKWMEGRFRDVAFRRIRYDSSPRPGKIAQSPSSKVTAIGECSAGPFFWVEEDNAGGRLLGANGDAVPATFLTLPEGKIHFIGCLGE